MSPLLLRSSRERPTDASPPKAGFYLTSMAVSGFSNVMGYGIAKMGGRYGLAAWRWIFLIFGVVTIGLGMLAYFIIVDFPDKNTFLTEKETAFVIDRINAERGDAEADKLTFGAAMNHLKDFKLWLFAVLFMCTTLPAYAFAYFLPIILSGGGYPVQTSLLLSAPPYISAAFYTFAVAYASDKFHQRALFIGINASVAMVGLFIMAFGGPLGLRYFGSFLAIAGCQGESHSTPSYSAHHTDSMLNLQPTFPPSSPTLPTTSSPTPSALSPPPSSLDSEASEESWPRLSVRPPPAPLLVALTDGTSLRRPSDRLPSLPPRTRSDHRSTGLDPRDPRRAHDALQERQRAGRGWHQGP